MSSPRGLDEGGIWGIIGLTSPHPEVLEDSLVGNGDDSRDEKEGERERVRIL